MGRSALLIIDMQNDFVLEAKPMRVVGDSAVIPKIQSVMAELRRKKWPVFNILRVHRADGSDVEVIRQYLFRKQPHGAAVIDELAPRPGWSISSPRPA
ncbi:MAG: isochorismatase family protein [Methanomicrobiales archaeon]